MEDAGEALENAQSFEREENETQLCSNKELLEVCKKSVCF